eukprot:TRINITY_DN11108_c1_g1_i1.p3 TRINITY_DN11108_c1_g1~~TRINITY_DN11108_c1_g1_i1.p3  ORF type:complete len:102 (-),score=0.03 TRINITY_DN11108_c1_g1_i1:1024-1329(-)
MNDIVFLPVTPPRWRCARIARGPPTWHGPAVLLGRQTRAYLSWGFSAFAAAFEGQGQRRSAAGQGQQCSASRLGAKGHAVPWSERLICGAGVMQPALHPPQ